MPTIQNNKSSSRKNFFATVPPQEILPIVNSRFESSVRGIFVIGDVTGMPLVKVAANQGKEVIEKMNRDGLFRTQAEEDERLDLVIIGAGPAGLSAAIEAEKLGLKYVVLERGKIASTVRSFPPGKMVYAEPQSLANQSELDVSNDLEKDEFLDRINQLVTTKKLRVKEDIEVARVRKSGERQFAVETKTDKSFPCRYVLVAVGRQGQPRLLDCPGADNATTVTYRMHSPDDYNDLDILVVGGGNSAIEAALLLSETNRVTLSYRGDNFFRAKTDNQQFLEEAERTGQLTIIRNSNVQEIRSDQVVLNVSGQTQSISNNQVIILIGSLPPVDFLMDMGLELDGIWTPRRLAMSMVGLAVGIFIYFFANLFVLHPDAAGDGKLLISGLSFLQNSPLLGWADTVFGWALPIMWLVLFGFNLLNWNRQARGHTPLFQIKSSKLLLFSGLFLYAFYSVAPHVFTLDPAVAGSGPYYVPGLTWIYNLIPTYFSNAYGLYYLLYFSAIAFFGLYWAMKSGHRLIWRRNIIIIATQWTLWWGIPTFLAVYLGRNPWTPLISRSINAWPLNLSAFKLDPAVGPGDPAWWHTVAAVGVVWATVLTFIVIPLVTIRWGKIYCTYFCSCGALAETVGNSFRHRGPKGDWPRKVERFGFVFIPLAAIATIADLMGFQGPLGYYNIWIGTFLSGAIAIGFYPFLGQRLWCRMWCPLAFWMNFWGRWSKFKITPEKGKCIDCNVCNQYCQMGIDIKSRAMQGIPVTLQDSPCVGCAECVVRCPMEILHLGDVPNEKLYQLNLPE